MPSLDSKQQTAYYSAHWKGAALDLLEVTPNGSRVVARFDGDTEEGEATRTVNALNQQALLIARNAELMAVLEAIVSAADSETIIAGKHKLTEGQKLIAQARAALTRAKSTP